MVLSSACLDVRHAQLEPAHANEEVDSPAVQEIGRQAPCSDPDVLTPGWDRLTRGDDAAHAPDLPVHLKRLSDGISRAAETSFGQAIANHGNPCRIQFLRLG